MSDPTAAKLNTKQIGSLGERLTATYLADRGYTILTTNYWHKWGEIDVIAKKDEVVYFIEVKTVSYETKALLEYSVTHETWQPEEQVHHFKLRQIEKALETWISENNYKGEWCIAVAAVKVVPRETFATIKYLENITQE